MDNSRNNEIKWNAYLLYLQDWVQLHKDVKYRGESPLSYKEWEAFQ